MATVTLGGNPVQTIGTLPEVGQAAPNFQLTRTNLSDVSLTDFAGKRLVLSISPSVDTDVCAAQMRRFNSDASDLGDDVAVLHVTRDLPFAIKRFCGAEDIDGVEGLSEMRNRNFGEAYGVTITNGVMAGLLTRAVVVLDAQHQVVYTQLVDEITSEPNYDAALEALKSA